MKLHLQHMEISGFRGINKPVQVDFDGRSLLLSGPNGFGKTSILQAIEWGLIGSVGLLEGEEFRREDALVSLFSEEGIARVELVVKDGKERLRLLRKRKRLSKTRGKSTLILNVDGQTFRTRDAEEKLAELLSLSREDYSTTIHLRQEIIRQLVEGNEKERSRAINRILGIDLLSDFGDIATKLIHSSSVVNRSFRGLQKMIAQLSVQRRTFNETKNTEERALEHAKARMVKRGIDFVELDEALNTLIAEIKRTATEVAQELSDDKLTERILHLEVPAKNVDIAEEVVSVMKETKRELESLVRNLVTKMREEVLELELLEKQRSSFLGQLEEMKIKNNAEVDDQMKTINAKLATLEIQFGSLQNRERKLRDLKDEVDSLQVRIDEFSGRVNTIIEDQGDEIVMQQKLTMLSEQRSNLNEGLNRLGTYNNLLDLALSYLETAKKRICPVCEQQIEYENVIFSVRKKLSEKIVKQTKNFRKMLDKTKDEAEATAETIRNLERLKNSLADHQTRLDDARQEFLEITKIKLVETLPKAIKHQIMSLRGLIEKGEHKIDEAKMRLGDLKRAQSIAENLAEVEEKIKETAGASGSSKQISAALQKVIKSRNEDIGKFTQIQNKVFGLDDEINSSEDIITFLKRSTSLIALRKSLDGTDQKLMVQQEKLQKLQALLEALTDIRDAVNFVRVKTLEAILSTIRKDLNNTYSGLLGHPVFVELQLMPEEEKGMQIYRLLARSREHTYGTYVRTRFSQAQRNLVAISLFLSMAKRTNFGLVILDDPSQSLDGQHKRALVEVLKTIMDEIQVVVATQDKDFSDLLVKSVPDSRMKSLGLSSWNENGPVIERVR